MSTIYIIEKTAAAGLDNQAFGDSALANESAKNQDEMHDEKISKAQKIWKDHKKAILISIITAVTLCAVLIPLFIIVLPKFKFDLKNHTNYGKFSRETCTLNHTINFNHDFSSLQIPWLVRILRKNKTEFIHSCAAFLIANDVILTAAHCLAEEGDLKISAVLFSETFDNNSNNIIQRQYLKLIPHPDYEFDNDDKTSDIGLIKLSKPLTLSDSFYPACLPFDQPTLPHDLSLIRWLYKDIEKMNIEKTEVAMMDSEECLTEYKKIAENKKIQFFKDEERLKFCVKYDLVVKTSNGHSGSPAIKTDDSGATVHGILISGGNEKSPLPDLYVIIHAHLKWILDNA